MAARLCLLRARARLRQNLTSRSYFKESMPGLTTKFVIQLRSVVSHIGEYAPKKPFDGVSEGATHIHCPSYHAQSRPCSSVISRNADVKALGCARAPVRSDCTPPCIQFQDCIQFCPHPRDTPHVRTQPRTTYIIRVGGVDVPLECVKGDLQTYGGVHIKLISRKRA